MGRSALRRSVLAKSPYSYGNSVGNLVLHLTGNLSYHRVGQIIYLSRELKKS